MRDLTPTHLAPTHLQGPKRGRMCVCVFVLMLSVMGHGGGRGMWWSWQTGKLLDGVGPQTQKALENMSKGEGMGGGMGLRN